MRLHVVLRDALTGGVHEPKGELRPGDFLVRRQPIPPDRFDVVLRDACAVEVNDPEVVLRVRDSLIRREPGSQRSLKFLSAKT